jgi:hypothetical protein
MAKINYNINISQLMAKYRKYAKESQLSINMWRKQCNGEESWLK